MILSVQGIEKSFHDGFKLGPCTFDASAGQVLAVLGPNGAGKTTLFQIITAQLQSDEGQVRFKGVPVTPEATDLKRQMGYLPQNPVLPEWMTPQEILLYAAQLHEMSNPTELVDSLCTYWDCDTFRHRPVAACSHGMQKRVGLALATLNDPDLLILDEPFSGLDIYQIKALHEAIKKRLTGGKVTLISSHITPYVTELCSHLITVKAGKVNQHPMWPGATPDQRAQKIEDFFFNGSQT